MSSLPRDNKREHNKQANRATLVEAARTCFVQMGFDAVTVRDIVRESGLAPGTFYNYFDDKESLFKEVLDERMSEITRRMHDLRASATTLSDFLFGAFQTLFEKIVEEPCFFELILRNEYAVRSLFKETVIGIPMQQLKADLNDAMSRGLFPELDVDLLAASLYGIAFEIGRVLCEQGGRNADQAARFATRMLVEGIQTFGLSGPRAKLGRGIAPGMTVIQT
ncbi:TetR/AcrR family transcriptional regulator [Nevskia sp.]|uniref:TetR/AcrR family transcriptional regulator n=1 Tax=Nevskia sp. TaxID=1929292 RepID=UPI0025FB8AC6|nr:TetR/AcrR family transcriptional regulator [Nevskia sp.]